MNTPILSLARPVAMILLALLAVAWIATGMIGREPPEPPAERVHAPMTVAVTELEAENIERLLVLQGRVDPGLRVTLRTETAGQVAEWQVVRGAEVSANQELLRLRMDDREARRRQAIARVRRMESEYEAARPLVADGHLPRIELEAREAELAAARAELEAIELDISNTRIRAPIDGIVNRRLVERGDFVDRGDAVAEIVDNDPLLAVVHVPQHQIARVSLQQPARIRFLDGRTAEGKVSFVSAVAEPGTRTFLVEIEVPNAEGAFPSGISAAVEIPTEQVQAHKVTPAVIGLDDSGQVGIKTVDEDHRVRFHPVRVIRTEPDGVWVTGLPDRARVITVGHGFVTAGEQVDPRIQDGIAPASEAQPAGDG